MHWIWSQLIGLLHNVYVVESISFCVFMCVCAHVRTHVLMNECTHVSFVCMCVFVHTYINVCVYVRVCMFCVYTCMYAHMCAHVYT